LQDLSYDANMTSSNQGLLVLQAIANDYMVSAPGTILAGAGNSSLGDQIRFASYGGNNNTTCGAGVNACSVFSNSGGNLLASIVPLADNAGFNESLSGGNTVNPYQLGLNISLANATNAGGASSDVKISAVPEPASMLLLGSVLLFAASGLRRRFRRRKTKSPFLERRTQVPLGGSAPQVSER
jgi:hypothetical protein